MTYSKPRVKDAESDSAEGSDEFEFTNLFGGEPMESSPEVEDSPGIRIAIEDPAINGGAFSGTLLVTAEFDSTYIDRFRRFMDAPVAILENVNSLDIRLFSLNDTQKRRPPAEADMANFLADSPSEVKDSGMAITQYRTIPFALPFNESDESRQLYIRVVLREHTSNVIAVSADEDLNPKLEHFLNGAPYEPFYTSEMELDDEGDDEEEDEEDVDG